MPSAAEECREPSWNVRESSGNFTLSGEWWNLGSGSWLAWATMHYMASTAHGKC